MIQSIMLAALGFLLACLIASLLAPTLYKRAARLTARRIESTMPLTLAEIEADKDQIRADFAVRLRRLETALARSKDRNAGQLVEISRLHMAISTLQDQAGEHQRNLEERRNAAAVFEQTIRKRFPELVDALAEAKQAIDEQATEISDLRNRLRRRDESLSETERLLQMHQADVKQLRDVLERSGGEQSGRFARRPSQWSLEEYRAEYDRLNVELSRLREELALAQDRETHQSAVLKTELQQLAQQIMISGAVGGGSEARPAEKRVGGVSPGPRRREEAAPLRPADPAGERRPKETGLPAGNGGGKATPAAPAAAHEDSGGEDGDKPGEPGVRSLLDRLRDIPESLPGA